MRFLFLIFLFSGCGFLDDEILMDEESYVENEQYIELDETSFRFGRRRGGGGYSSYSRGHRYYSGYAHPPGPRVRKLVMRPGKKSPKNDNKEKSSEQENAIDARSTFIRVVNNYGAKAHDLEEKL